MTDLSEIEALAAIVRQEHDSYTDESSLRAAQLARSIPALVAELRAERERADTAMAMLGELIDDIDDASEREPETTDAFDAWERVWSGPVKAARSLLSETAKP